MKIVITGPESTGKTTLVEELSDYFKIDHVPEIARSYLQILENEYKYSDLLKIAQEQQKVIDDKAKIGDLIISDTDLLTLKIWSEYKYDKCDHWIINKLHEKRPDLYLVCKPDIPWEADPLRENPNNREKIFQIYISEIKQLEVTSVEITGDRGQRLSLAINAIEELINQD